jgi:hypothetical protein
MALRTSWVSRFFAALLMGLTVGAYIHNTQIERWHRMGRDAFLNYQAQRFTHSIAAPRPLLQAEIGFAVVFLLLFGIYELAALFIEHVVKTLDSEKPQNDVLVRPNQG